MVCLLIHITPCLDADYHDKLWLFIVNFPSLSHRFSVVTVPKVALFDFLLAADIVCYIR